MTKKFCSIEYLDDEGEEVVKHAFLSFEEQDTLMQEFAHRGVVAQIHDLTPPQCIEEDPVVLSGYAKPQLGSSS